MRRVVRKTQASASGTAAASESTDIWTLLMADGQEYGPISKAELDRWVADGRVVAGAQVYCEGWSEWQWAEQLYPRLAQTAPSTAPAINAPEVPAIPTFSTSAMNQGASPYISPATPPGFGTASAGAGQGFEPAWFVVRAGLKVAMFSLLMGLLGLTMLGMGMLSGRALFGTAAQGPVSSGAATGAGLLMVSGAWGMLAMACSTISLCTSWCVCTNVPRRSYAKGRITAAVACVASAIGILFLSSLMMFGMLDPSYIGVVGWLVHAALFIALAMFALFLGAVGKHFSDHGLSQIAVFFVVFEVAHEIWTILVVYVIRPTSSEMAMAVLAITFLCAFVSYGWLLYLTNRALVVLRRTQTQWGKA